MKLYSFFNSSTSYRVRIALALKGLDVEYEGINIREQANRDVEYIATINPSASVPALVDGDFKLGQSLAIIDYLDQCHPEPRLIPSEPTLRARVLEFAAVIACDIHPINNLRVLRYLQNELGVSEEQKQKWYDYWVQDGFAMAERLLDAYGNGSWCFGDSPTLADCCLIPQVLNAQRMGCDLSAFPRLLAVVAHAEKHPAFIHAAPQQQPDYIS